MDTAPSPSTASSQAGMASRQTSGPRGAPILWYDTVGSTMDVARSLAEGGAAHGTTVVAAHQRAGRGRLGRRWASPRGGLYLSVIYREQGTGNREQGTGRTLVGAEGLASPPTARGSDKLWVPAAGAGVGLAEALRAQTGVRVGLKWPNDVLCRGRKLGGVLAEASLEGTLVRHVIVGLGANINLEAQAFPPELRHSATSLLMETGRRCDLEPLAWAVLYRFLTRAEEGLRRPAALLARWRELDCTGGAYVRVEAAGKALEGECLGVDEDWCLLVRTTQGPRRVTAGEVTLLRPAEAGSAGVSPA